MGFPERNEPWRLALIGANGMLARKVLAAAPANIEVAGFDLPGFDITRPEQVRAALLPLRPDLIINCAAYTAVDQCEADGSVAMAVNGDAVATLASVAGECGALLVHVSTDYVFDGRKGSPYVETDPVGPLSVYGRSKLAGEQAIIDSGLERHLIVRTSWLHGPDGKNFVATILRLAGEREELRVVADQVGSPTFTGDLAKAIFHLMAAAVSPRSPASSPQPPAPGLYGIYHFANAGKCSWHEFASAIVEEAKALGVHLALRRIVPIGTEEYPLPAPRPAWSVLSTQRYQTVTGCGVPGWRDGLRRHLLEIYRGSQGC